MDISVSLRSRYSLVTASPRYCSPVATVPNVWWCTHTTCTLTLHEPALLNSHPHPPPSINETRKQRCEESQQGGRAVSLCSECTPLPYPTPPLFHALRQIQVSVLRMLTPHLAAIAHRPSWMQPSAPPLACRSVDTCGTGGAGPAHYLYFVCYFTPLPCLQYQYYPDHADGPEDSPFVNSVDELRAIHKSPALKPTSDPHRARELRIS